MTTEEKIKNIIKGTTEAMKDMNEEQKQYALEAQNNAIQAVLEQEGRK